MKFTSVFFLTIFSISSPLHAALAAGDMSIIGFRTDATDAIAFVVWTTVVAGEKIHFTDAGFFADGTLRDSEDVMTWTAPLGGLAIGTVVVISSPDSPGTVTVNLGTVTDRLNGLAAGGDQIFAGTTAFPDTGDTTAPGSSYTGTLLFGLDTSGAVGWDAAAVNTFTSALPSALNSLGLNISFGDVDNGQYIGSRAGLTLAQFKTAVTTPSNWITSDDGPTFGALSATPFGVIPEPSTTLVGSLGLLALLRRRR